MRTLSIFVLILFFALGLSAKEKPGIAFIENKHQWNAAALYRADIHGGYMFLNSKGFSFLFLDTKKITEGHLQENFSSNESGDFSVEQACNAWNVSVSFVNAQVTTPFPSESTGASYNYFIGSEESKWGYNAQAFRHVVYPDFYEGIQLDVYSSGVHPKYDFIVEPGADPTQIEWKYEGVNSLTIEEGSLYAHTTLADVVERKPYAYQVKNGFKIDVPVEFVLRESSVTYSFPEGYDACYELVIDPILIFSAYSGSISDNWGNTSTYDSRGNTYSGGIVNAFLSTGYPTTPGAYQIQAKGGEWDIGILKFDSSGSKLLYATYLGGSGVETPQSLVVDNDDNLLILGATSSSDFPKATSLFKGGEGIDPLGGIPYSNGTDVFIAKLSKDGSQLLSSRYFGGTKNDGVNFVSGNMGTNTKVESPLARNYGDQLRGDIVIDENNNIYIATNTLSDDLPAAVNTFAGGSHDAVVACFTPNLEILWSRYVGGTKTDAAYSIKVKQQTLLVGGGTESTDLVNMNGFKSANEGGIDGWIVELDRNGSSVVGGTYLGTAAYDQVYFIDVNEAGEVYAFGQTQGAYPVQGNVYRNTEGGQFIHKLSADLTNSLLSTVIGSGGRSPNLSPTAFLVSDCNNLYLSGWGGAINVPTTVGNNGATIFRNYVGGSTSGLPTSADAFQRTTSGNDFYFMVLSADASEFLYGTFLGGTSSRTHVDGGTSRFDKQGIVYHAVCAGCGGQSDFPAVNVPVAYRTNRSQNCNNAVFKFDLSSLKARLQTNNEARNFPGISDICFPDGIVFQNLSSGGEVFQWNLGDGSPTKILFDTASFLYYYKTPGVYMVTLTAIDQGTCKVRDVVTKTIRVLESISQVQDDDVMCEGDTYQLSASGGIQYRWVSNDKTSFSGPTPMISPERSTDYYLTLTEATGCSRLDTVSIAVIPALVPEFELERQASCLMRPMVSVKNPQIDSTRYTFLFDFGDGTTSDLAAAEHTYEKDSVYSVKLIAQREFCVYEQIQPIDITTILIPNVLTPSVKDGKNDVFTIQYGKEGSTPGTRGLKVRLFVYNRWGNLVYANEDYQYNWSGTDLVSGVYFYEATIEGYTTCKDWLHLIK